MLKKANSIVHYLSEEKPDRCGYCKNKNSSAKYGLWAYQLSVEDYQDLIDRGWRRCGHYCYKPIIKSTCCPMYTIRCSAKDFKPSKSQKRILKKFNGFINFDITTKPRREFARIDEVNVSFPIEAPLSNMDDLRSLPELSNVQSNQFEKIEVPKEKMHVVYSKSESNLKISANPLKKKQIRINRKREKLRSRGLTEEEISLKMVEKKRFPVNKNLEDFMSQGGSDNAAHKLQVKLVRSSPRSPEFEESFEESFLLYKRYQVAIHNDPEGSINRRSFERFLVDSPLIEDSQYGSFHQQYWIDGKLIAVGVVDILPKCVSSVYLYYDPDFAFLALGTFSALRELYFVRGLNKSYPDLEYYYMGYYIRSCPKMRYKGAYYPSFLLCPEVYTWHPLEMSLPKIDALKNPRLNGNPEERDEEGLSAQIDNVYLYGPPLKFLTEKYWLLWSWFSDPCSLQKEDSIAWSNAYYEITYSPL